MKENKKSRFGLRALALVISTVILLSTLTACGALDLLSDDLSDYVYISEADYKSYKVDGVLEEYSEAALLRKINKILVENRAKEPTDYTGYINKPITLGDQLSVFYRGYTVDENGKEIPITNGTNFGGSEKNFAVGSGSFTTAGGVFVPGVEEALLGKIPSEYGNYFATGMGKPTEDMIVYLTYYSFSEGGDKNVVRERVDLMREDIDKEYGDGFREFILSSEIGKDLGTKTLKKDGKSIVYQGITIEFATDFERNPITVEVKFPGNCSDKELRGVSAKFDIFVEYLVDYETPELNSEFIIKTLGVTESDLSSYTGADTVEKFKNMLRDEVKAEIELSNDTLRSEAMWKHYLAKVEVKEIPEEEYENCYNSFYNEVLDAYENNKDNFASIDECAIAYLNDIYSLAIPQKGDWRKTLESYTEEVVIKQILFYYVIREEGFLPTEAEYNALYGEIFEETFQGILKNQQESLATLEKDAYDAYVEDLRKDVMEYYGDDYFRQSVYYRFGMSKLYQFAKVG